MWRSRNNRFSGPKFEPRQTLSECLQPGLPGGLHDALPGPGCLNQYQPCACGMRNATSQARLFQSINNAAHRWPSHLFDAGKGAQRLRTGIYQYRKRGEPGCGEARPLIHGPQTPQQMDGKGIELFGGKMIGR